ncbi:HD-GYP domain-containing protein [Deinococcus sonorensis]|uniref:HD-GYP domain-containing protein n=2 Tax=Deinococcus sonorensis TaxID=309891 RepID=A0AAU7U8M9_9DEIO
MSLPQPVRLVLGGLIFIGLVLAALSGQALVLCGAALLLASVVWPLGGRWYLVPPLAFGLGYLVVAARFPFDVMDWLGVLLALLGLAGLTRWYLTGVRQSARMRNVMRALEEGSAKLSVARDSDGMIRAGIETLERLKVAPHLAFVAYKRGTPHIMGARGNFRPFLEHPILPEDGDSRSVHADHWVADHALKLLTPPERAHHLVVPVSGMSEQQIGLLLLARPGQPFAGSDETVVKSFARLLGLALGQWHAIRELRDANELTLKSLGAALEHRDDETGGHTGRVEALSVQLARRLGWTEDRVKALRWGAYLHDLGKLAVPDAVLHKAGPLLPEERLVMQRHTVLGYDMLQELHFLPAETLDLVRYHHERWDGTGYPSGLSSHDIPATARVFSIVDVYDALISVRPYKPAWSKERALAEIRLQAGRQFDPQYVDAFLYMMAEKDDARLVR